MVQPRRKKVENNQHEDFPSGHPPEYYPRLSLFNFAERTGCSSVRLIWPIICTNSGSGIYSDQLYCWFEQILHFEGGRSTFTAQSALIEHRMDITNLYRPRPTMAKHPSTSKSAYHVWRNVSSPTGMLRLAVCRVVKDRKGSILSYRE
jgi:hypothetical protein